MPELSKEQKLIMLGLITIIIIGCIVIVFNKYSVTNDDSEVLIDVTNDVKVVSNAQEWIIVHVNGAVRKEGVYKLKYGDRIYDLIVLAGGIHSGADIKSINFAAALSDGQKINIPFKTESQGITSTSSGKSGSASNVVNLNSAGKSELISLPGIGTATAQKILELREKKGRFSDISELKEIRGISDKKIKKLSAYLIVN